MMNTIAVVLKSLGVARTGLVRVADGGSVNVPVFGCSVNVPVFGCSARDSIRI